MTKSIQPYIDHTLLKPTASTSDIVALCKEAIEYQFYAVCVNSCYVALAKKTLLNSPINVCSVIGFPLGAMHTNAKVKETEIAIAEGADEIDMVINIGFLKSGNLTAFQNDIERVKKATSNRPLKVILETGYLTNEEIIKACKISVEAGADFIKTSTGFGTRGATLEDIELIKSTAKGNAKIKASGGIRDYETAKKFIDAGVDRIGTSSGVKIIKELDK